MRTGRFIFILFLLCSLIIQVTGEGRTSAHGSKHQIVSSDSSSRDDNINTFNFVDENLFDEMEEFEESEHQNEKKARKYFCRKLFAAGQTLYGYVSKYHRKKAVGMAGKYNTSQCKHVRLLL